MAATILYNSGFMTALGSLGPVVQHNNGNLVDVLPFTYLRNGSKLAYSGITEIGTFNGTPNYLFLDSDGLLNVTQLGYPKDGSWHLPIARVTTTAGTVAVIQLDLATRYPLSTTSGIPIPLPAVPATPPDGNRVFYPVSVTGGQVALAAIDPSGRVTLQQPDIVDSTVLYVMPRTGSGLDRLGASNPASTGTLSVPALTSTSLITSTMRWTRTSASSANSMAEDHLPDYVFIRGNVAKRGGIYLVILFSFNGLSTNCRGFFGLTSSTSSISATQVPSALTNCVGVTWDATETTLRIGSNDASGSMTRSDLGANFPVATGKMYQLTLGATSNSSSIEYELLNRTDGFTATGTLTTDLPGNTVPLAVHTYMNNGGDAVAVSTNIMSIYGSDHF